MAATISCVEKTTRRSARASVTNSSAGFVTKNAMRFSTNGAVGPPMPSRPAT